MSGRQQKKKRLAERRRYVQRFMANYIAELRQILKRAWPAYERRHPGTRGPLPHLRVQPAHGHLDRIRKDRDGVDGGDPDGPAVLLP